MVEHSPKVRFSFIDGLRGLASLSVVFFHAGAGGHIDRLPDIVLKILTFGELCVPVFFVISGFVITHSLRNIDMSAAGLGQFMLKRSIRLDPPYWAVLIGTAALSWFAAAFLPSLTADLHTIDQLLAHMVYAQDILGYPLVNAAFWTLAYEIQFYIVFALLLATRSPDVLIAAFVLSLLWPVGIGPDVPGLFVNLFYAFLLGVGAYLSWQRQGVRLWFAGYACVILVASVINGNLFGLACVITALGLVAIAMAGKLGSFSSVWPLQFLGLISYSLYLTHNPVSGIGFRLWYALVGRSPHTEALGLLVVVSICIAVATAFYYLVERPFIALSNSRPTRRIGTA